MKNSPYKQQGMTFPGMVLTLGLGVFFLTLAFKIGPIYTEHATIKTAMESVKAQPDLTNNTRDMIISLLQKRLEVNNVRILVPENISVTKHGGYVKVEITYDQTVHLFGNLDVVAHFNDAFEVGAE